jgi:hypothetical protein
MDQREQIPLAEFDCPEEPLPENTPAEPRPSARPRQTGSCSREGLPSLQSFDCEADSIVPQEKAAPRPKGRERRTRN